MKTNGLTAYFYSVDNLLINKFGTLGGITYFGAMKFEATIKEIPEPKQDYAKAKEIVKNLPVGEFFILEIGNVDEFIRYVNLLKHEKRYRITAGDLNLVKVTRLKDYELKPVKPIKVKKISNIEYALKNDIKVDDVSRSIKQDYAKAKDIYERLNIGEYCFCEVNSFDEFYRYLNTLANNYDYSGKKLRKYTFIRNRPLWVKVKRLA